MLNLESLLTVAAHRGGHPAAARLRGEKPIQPADAGWLGGRVKPGHGENAS
jgi:hypothetical protein